MSNSLSLGHEKGKLVLDKEISLLSSSFDMYLKYKVHEYPTHRDKLLAFQKNTVTTVCTLCSSPYHYPATCGMMMHWHTPSPLPVVYNSSAKLFNSPTSQRNSNNNTANSTPTRSSSNPFLHTPTSVNSTSGYIMTTPPPYRDLFKIYYDFFISANEKIDEYRQELGLIDDVDNIFNNDHKQDISTISYARISLSAWQIISLSSRFLAYIQVYLNYHQSIPISLSLSLASFQESVSKLYIIINHTSWDKDKDKNKIYAIINAIKKKYILALTILEQ